MSNMDKIEKRLPINFHQTFIPERNYISAIMEFSSKNESATLEQISKKTGIPMGKSSGKVMPTILYAEGMGLINSKKMGQELKIDLTDLGKVVFREDKLLKEKFTQWILHLNLCRRRGGAEIWYRTFSESHKILGYRFSRDQLDAFLNNKYGKKRRSLIGPMISMYNEDRSFGRAGCLKQKDNIIIREIPTLDKGFARGITAILMTLIEEYFPDRIQITQDEIEKEAHFFSINGWQDNAISNFLNYTSELDAFDIDRQIGSPMLHKKQNASYLIDTLYNDLI